MDNNDTIISQIIHDFAMESRHILQNDLVAEYLFGSYATNTYTSLSDIDILIIVKNYRSDMQYELSGLASEYALKYDVCISPIVKDVKLWEKNRLFNTLFYQEIVQ